MHQCLPFRQHCWSGLRPAPWKDCAREETWAGERVVLPFADSPSSKEKPVQAQGDPVAALLSPSPPQSELSVDTLFPGTGR